MLYSFNCCFSVCLCQNNQFCGNITDPGTCHSPYRLQSVVSIVKRSLRRKQMYYIQPHIAVIQVALLQQPPNFTSTSVGQHNITDTSSKMTMNLSFRYLQSQQKLCSHSLTMTTLSISTLFQKPSLPHFVLAIWYSQNTS